MNNHQQKRTNYSENFCDTTRFSILFPHALQTIPQRVPSHGFEII